MLGQFCEGNKAMCADFSDVLEFFELDFDNFVEA